ncbi:hypothetical protein E4198_10900 [Streptomyces sp. RKND-216]|uniref:hypothetical protein n=1 Tax=Streptomyces sp. RKND-216 TaxID=2562581 RepID=UPI00109DA948|nr:hypothetical protein [Streptomyces sp. RKND-216]THA25168.1 hypothetical protein E4198_10900 [Streptomyces sp. RKND-216]
MDYVAALTPPLVMAIGFTALVVTIVKNQGGANKAKEDAAVDAALDSAADGAHRPVAARSASSADAAARATDS